MSKKLLFGDRADLIAKFLTKDGYSDINYPIFNENCKRGFRNVHFSVDRIRQTHDVYQNFHFAIKDFESISFDSSSDDFFFGPTVFSIEHLKITPDITNMSCMFNECDELQSIILSDNCDTSNVTDMSHMFSGCRSLRLVKNINNLDTSNVTDMSYTFFNVKSLFHLDLSNWNTSNVTNMSHMFGSIIESYDGISLFSLNIGSWDTSNVTDMSYMFSGKRGLTFLDVSNWKVSKVTNMEYMFYECQSLASLDLSNWNTSNVTNMTWMFGTCSSLTNLDASNWNVSNVTDMSYMFANCSSLTTLDISNWKNYKYINMENIFYGANNLKSVKMSNCNNSLINSIVRTLPYRNNEESGELILTSGVNDDLSTDILSILSEKNWIVYHDDGSYIRPVITDRNKNLVSMVYIRVRYGTPVSEIIPVTFNDGYIYEREDIHIYGYDDGYSDDYIFYLVKFYSNYDFSSFKINNDSDEFDVIEVTYLKLTDKVTNMNEMFVFQSDVNTNGWDTSNVTDMSYMSSESSLVFLDITDWDTSKVTNMSHMFYDCINLDLLDLNNWNTSKVTNMSNMFNGCIGLISLNLSEWDTSKVTNMSHMFSGCFMLAEADVSNWNVSNVTDMSYMFYDCINLDSRLNVSNWEVSKVTNMSHMFHLDSLDKSINDDALSTTLNISKWNTGSVTDMSYMFADRDKLESLDISNWNVSNVTDMSYMFYYCYNLTELDLSHWDMSNVTNMSNMFYACPNLTELDLSGLCNNTVLNNCTKMFAPGPDHAGLWDHTYIKKLTLLNCSPEIVRQIANELPDRRLELPEPVVILSKGFNDSQALNLITDKGWQAVFK